MEQQEKWIKSVRNAAISAQTMGAIYLIIGLFGIYATVTAANAGILGTFFGALGGGRLIEGFYVTLGFSIVMGLLLIFLGSKVKRNVANSTPLLIVMLLLSIVIFFISKTLIWILSIILLIQLIYALVVAKKLKALGTATPSQNQ